MTRAVLDLRALGDPDVLRVFAAGLSDLAGAVRELADAVESSPSAQQPAVGALVSTKVAAQARGVHQKTVEKKCREGVVPGAVKVGRSWRLPVDALDAVPAPGSTSSRPVSRPGNAKPRRRPRSNLEAPYNQSGPGSVDALRGPGRTPEVPTMKNSTGREDAAVLAILGRDRGRS